jgi:hypothetical protein
LSLPLKMEKGNTVCQFTLLENCHSFTIAPPALDILNRDTMYWTPASLTPEDLAHRQRHYLNVVARLKPGVTLERARRDMDAIAKRLQQQYPDSNTHLGAVVIPLREDFAGDTATGLWVLQIAAVQRAC